MQIDTSQAIERNENGTLIVHLVPERSHESESSTDTSPASQDVDELTRLLHPGEGGYDEALTAWDNQQHPDHESISTADGRREAMHAIHEIASSPDHEVASAIAAINDREASAEALRFLLVGGPHAVDDFAKEIANSEGGEPLQTHVATKIIGEVLAGLE